MPPKTAMRWNSGIAPPTAGVGTDGAILITGITGVVPQGIRLLRFRQRGAQACVWSLDENGTNPDAAIGDDPAMLADEQAGVKTLHHLWRDIFLGVIAALAFDLGPQTQRGQYLQP